jgi:hypothetical protein
MHQPPTGLRNGFGFDLPAHSGSTMCNTNIDFFGSTPIVTTLWLNSYCYDTLLGWNINLGSLDCGINFGCKSLESGMNFGVNPWIAG